MALFAVLLPKVNQQIAASIKEKFPGNDHFELCATQWIVSGKGTAKKISDTIGISGDDDNSLGSGVVLPFTTYWGRASTDLWEWMKAKIEESDNG